LKIPSSFEPSPLGEKEEKECSRISNYSFVFALAPIEIKIP